MMRSTVVRQELAVGAFLCAAVGLVLVGGYMKTRERGLIGGASFRFAAKNGAGLQAGAPVLMQGIQVGEVSDIQLTADNEVLVTCQVAPRFARSVRQDAVATIVEPPLLGSTKVELAPGKSEARLADKQQVAAGAQGSITTQLSELQGRVDGVVERVERFVTQATTTLETVDRVVARVDRGEGLAGRLLTDGQLAEDAAAAVARLSRVAGELDEGQGLVGMALRDPKLADDVRAAAEGTAAIVRRAEQGEGTLGRLLRDEALADEATGLLRDARGALARLDELNLKTQESLAKVTALLDTANTSVGDLQGLLKNAERVSGELADTLHRVNQGQGTIAAFLNDDAVYRETRSLLKELRESVEDLREQAPINSFLGVVFAAF
ncbi:MAG: MCE family protein [Planctomycetes bacterium]|nr:MCE family protein [Planctomycetota bacterium]